MKRFFLLVIGLLAALAAVVVVLPSFFNWNSQKELIETRASEALGLPVSIDGDLSLTVLPIPRLSAGGLSVGSKETLSEGPFVSAQLIDIEVALMPLFSGEVKATSIVLEKPEIMLMTGQPQSSDDTPSSQPNITLPKVVVETGKIVLVDAQTGKETAISNINAELAAQSVKGPFSIDTTLAFEGQPLDLHIETGQIDQLDFPFSINVQAPDAGKFEASVKGNASDALGDRPSANASILISADDVGQLLSQIGQTQTQPLNGETLRISARTVLLGQEVSLADLNLDVGDLRLEGSGRAKLGEEQSEINATLQAGRLDLGPFLTGQDASSTAIDKIEATLPKGIKATVQMQIDDLRGLPVTMQQVGIAARLSDARVDMSLTRALLPGGVTLSTDATLEEKSGQLVGPFKARITGANAAPLLSELLGPAQALPPSPIPIDVQVDGAVERSDLRVKAMVGAIGATTVNGSAKVGYGPALNAEIQARLGKVNLDHWLSNTSSPRSDTAAKSPGFDGSLRADLTIASLIRGGETYDDLSMIGTITGDAARIESLSLGKAPGAVVSAKGTISGLSREDSALDLEIKASGNNAGQLLALAGQAPNETLTKAGKVALSGTVTGTTQAPKIAAEGTLGSAKIDLTALASGLDKASPNVSGDVSVSHPNFAALLTQLEMVESTARGSTAQNMQLSSRFNLAGGETSASFNARTQAGNVNATYEDTSGRLAMAINAAAPDITAFMRSLGFDFNPAQARLGGLKTDIALSGTQDALVTRSLAVTLGPATLTGSGRIDTSGPVTKVDLRLQGDNLDLAALMPEAETGAQQAYSGTGERWSKEPLDLAMLDSVDGVISLDLNRLTWRTYELKNASASVSSEGRTLRMALDRGTLFDGPASMAIALDATDVPALEVDMAIQGGDVAQAAQSSAAIAPLTGTFDLNGKFAGAGVSEYDIVKSLNGRASFAARDGMINGIDIVRVNERFGNLRTVADFVQVAGSALRGGETHYDLIAVDVTAKNGNLFAQNMRTQIDGGAQAALDARIDLPAWDVSAQGAFSLADHPQAPPVGVRIAGPLDHPRIEYETKQIQNYLGARFGAAVLKGVISGDGFGFKEILGGGQQSETQGDQTTAPGEDTSQNAASQNQQQRQARPEDQLRDLILEGLFGGRKNRNP